MAKTLSIVVLSLLVAWQSAHVIRLERYHYAAFLGLCADQAPVDLVASVKRHQCLSTTETRTSPLWHLWYGMVDTY